MAAAVSDALLKLQCEWDGHEVDRVDTGKSACWYRWRPRLRRGTTSHATPIRPWVYSTRPVVIDRVKFPR